MKYNQILNKLTLLIIISPILSELYHLNKIPTKLKSLHREHYRNLSPENESSFLENVYGDSYDLNYYYATLYFGPKKMPQTFIIDTGSPTTTSPCSKCTKCGKHLNKPYEFNSNSKILQCYSDECNSLSSSCSNGKCSFYISYSEGSRLEGFFSLQDISLENINKSPIISSKSFTIPIGCTTTETHLFLTQLADGIMGLNNSGKSFVSLLYKYKAIEKEMFSICLGQNNGYFSVGEVDTKFHKSNISYVPLSEGHTNFYINVNNMKVGDGIVSTKNYKIFVDSGTTITYFPREIFNPIIDNFNNYCQKNGNKCGKFENVEGIGLCAMFNSNQERLNALNNYWPNITLFLENYNYTLTPDLYFFEYNAGKRNGACLGFEGEGASKITVGGTFMHGHDIIFDRENQRMGFAEADCNRKEDITSDINYSDNYSYITDVDVEPKHRNDTTKNFNEKFLIGIIIISGVLVICLIILLIFIIGKKHKIERYNTQINESDYNKKNNENNENNNVLEVKSQKTDITNKSNNNNTPNT